MTETVLEYESNYYGEDSATFGDRVAAGRIGVGLDQAGLSQKLGIKKKTLIGWENDMSEPRANKLQMLAGILNVSIVWLLTGNGEGLVDPSLTPRESEDTTALLLELRTIRGEYGRLNDRLARLEKRLRVSM